MTRFRLACTLAVLSGALGAAALLVPRAWEGDAPRAIWLSPWQVPVDPRRTPGGERIDGLRFVGGGVLGFRFWSVTFGIESGRRVTYRETGAFVRLPSGGWTRYVREPEDGGSQP